MVYAVLRGSHILGTLNIHTHYKQTTTTTKHLEEGENQHKEFEKFYTKGKGILALQCLRILTCWWMFYTLLPLHPWSAFHDRSQALPHHKASVEPSILPCDLLFSNPISLEILLRYYVMRRHHCSLLHWQWPCSLNEPWNSLTIRSPWHASDPSRDSYTK